jgi:aspartyl protease family protein
MARHAAALAAAALWVLAAVPGAWAQTVSLSGTLGASKALLLIDGQPHTVAVGSTVKGVTLTRLADGEAEVETGGKRALLRLGAAPARVGAGSGGNSGGSTEIVLPVSAGGHFIAQGSINGKQAQFLVDTGATWVAMSVSEATRIGLDWRNGQRGYSATAGGTVPVYGLTLRSIRVGEVEVFNVEAVVLQADMPAILLGNSFLNRFTMRRDADTMRLQRK